MSTLPLLLLLMGLAQAGDPCPIAVQIAAFSPPWRDRSADLAALTVQRQWFGLTYRESGGGLVVRASQPDSPAEAAGVMAGDAILTANGSPVSTRAALSAAFDALGPADALVLGLSRGGALLERSLRPGPVDPLVLGLVQALETQDCRSVSLSPLDEAQGKALVAGAFTAAHGFRCDDAHKALASSFPSGTVVVVRGGDRVMFTAPGWATRCVERADVDGPGLDSAALRARMDALLVGYVRDRHDNP